MKGTVKGSARDGWVNVLLDEKPEHGVIPFRERELSILSAD